MDEANLEKALKTLAEAQYQRLLTFGANEFLNTGVDPFRFALNIGLWGIELAISKEVEHKLEMALENLVGDFHENYLGNVCHDPTSFRWRQVPNGQIPGVDIANDELKAYLQIKSKHNSMNSSSAKRLAHELATLRGSDPEAKIGCLFIVAKQGQTPIGAKLLIEAGADVHKGSTAYAYVTGRPTEMHDVLRFIEKSIQKVISPKDYRAALDATVKRVIAQLKAQAAARGMTVAQYVEARSVD